MGLSTGLSVHLLRIATLLLVLQHSQSGLVVAVARHSFTDAGRSLGDDQLPPQAAGPGAVGADAVPARAVPDAHAGCADEGSATHFAGILLILTVHLRQRYASLKAGLPNLA